MAIRGIGDAYAFQRLLWLLVGTVVVPTALLALYGVVAIRNERHAMGERVRLERVERIQWAHTLAMERLQQAAASVEQGVVDCSAQAPCEVGHPVVREVVTWPTDAAPPERLEGTETPDPGTSLWTRTASGAPVHTGSRGSLRYAWWPRLEAVGDAVAMATSERWPDAAPVILEAEQGVSPLETFERWHSYRPVLPLAVPFEDYHLSIGPDDPQDRAAVLLPRSERSVLLSACPHQVHPRLQ